MANEYKSLMVVLKDKIYDLLLIYKFLINMEYNPL